MPVHVVDIDLAAHGVEEPHLVDHGGEQLGVMADDDEAAAVRGQERPQPGDRVGVEVVGRLVEQEGGGTRRAATPAVGRGEQDPGQLDPAALTARQRRDLLAEHPLGEPEVGADARGVAFRRVPAERGEPLLDAPVLAHRPFVLRPVDQLGHRRLRLLHLAEHLVEAARGQDAVLGGDREVAFAGVLRQVADRAGPADRASVRLALAGEDPHGGGLARAVAADEADAVAGLHAQGCVGQQDARPGPQFEVGGGDQRRFSGGRGQAGRWT